MYPKWRPNGKPPPLEGLPLLPHAFREKSTRQLPANTAFHMPRRGNSILGSPRLPNVHPRGPRFPTTLPLDIFQQDIEYLKKLSAMSPK